MGGQIFPLVEGGDKAPPEDASAQGGRRFPCREFTPFLCGVEEILLNGRG